MVLDKPENKENGQDVAIFFDFENIVYSLRHSMGKNPNFEILMEKCQEYGRVVLARAYADWSRHNTVIAPLQASGFDPVYVPTYFYENHERRTRKNAVDIHIAIEAVEVLFTQPQITTFILLTGDKDFIPLANALRRHGKTVIAIGVRGTTSPYMRQATDDFVYYHQLLEEPFGKKPKPPRQDIYASLVEAVKKLERDDQKTVFPAVKHTLSEMLESFNEKNYKDAKGVPFNRFKDFILEAQRLGYVKLITTGSVNVVLLPDADTPEPAAQSTPDAKPSESAEPALQPPPEIANDTETAFELLVWAVKHAKLAGKSPRTSSIKTIMRSAVNDFDEKELPEEKFAKFSDFTRAAEARGLVRITGKGIMMEIHPPKEALMVEKIEPEPQVEIVGSEPEVDPQPVTLPEIAEPELVQLSPIVEPEVAPVTLEPSGDLEPLAVDQLPTTLKEPTLYISDYRLRVVVIDALRSCEYPALPHIIARHCLDLSTRRQVTLSNRRLNQLLTTASEIGLLQPGGDDLPNHYIFVEDPNRVSQFLDGEE